jgi:hypothetical protein
MMLLPNASAIRATERAITILLAPRFLARFCSLVSLPAKKKGKEVYLPPDDAPGCRLYPIRLSILSDLA